MRSALFVGSAIALAWLGGCCNAPVAPPAPIGQPAIGPSPNTFPGPAAFQGGYVAQTEPVNYGLQSTYSGTIVVTMLDSSIVNSVLPNGMRLADRNGGSSAFHPVIHVIGDQLEPTTVVGGWSPPSVAAGYREVILLIPFVVSSTGTGKWHNYAARMYLDDPTAVAGGNLIYGYAKELAHISKSVTYPKTTQEIKTPDLSITWFHSDVQLTIATGDPWLNEGSAGSALPRWADLKTIMGMPVLGIIPASGFASARNVCSYWEWNFGNAQVAPATSKHKFVTKFRDGMEGWVTLGDVTNALDGAVSMRGLRWRLVDNVVQPLEPCKF